MIKGEIVERLYNSKFLQEKVPLLIYLPEKYSELKKYPVLFVQDGWEYLTSGRLATQVDHMIDRHQIAELIVVAIPTENKYDRQEKYSPTGSKHKAYLRFLAEELVPYIDREYSTLCLGGSRAIMGDSLGAVVSLHAVLKYPHTFATLISQSGLLLPETIETIHSHPGKCHLQIYLSVGNQEEQVETSRGLLNIVEMNKELQHLLKSFAYVTLNIRDGGHTWENWQSDIKDALLHYWGI